MSRVVALVQARMGSSRFPGKMLARLGDFPILEWVLRRLTESELIDKTILATTTRCADEGLLQIASKCNVDVFRGSEEDVLGRFFEAALQNNADLVVRVCADNPFIDAAEIDRLIEAFAEESWRLRLQSSESNGKQLCGRIGAELITMNVLSEIAAEASAAEHREHVSKFIWDHPERFSIFSLPSPAELAYPDYRFDIDTHEDLEHLLSLVRAGVSISTPAAKIIEIENCLVNSS